MIRNISIGVDVGTLTTKVVVAEFLKGEKNPRIIGDGTALTKGLRHGYVTDTALAKETLRKAISSAEKSSGIKIRRAAVSIGSVTVRGEISNGAGIVSKADGEVTKLDLDKTLENCEENLSLNNKKVLGVFPISFKLDGKEILGRTEGLRGTKLETKALFATSSAPHFEDLLEIVTAAGVEPTDISVASLAGARIALSQRQKIVGCALVDIGSETTSLAVFENDVLTSLHTFSIGGSDITNDIALGLKVTLEEAEHLKLGSAAESFPPDGRASSKKKLDEIIEARLYDIFELIENHLKKIKRNELLPAGVVFIGGGANIPMLIEISKKVLKLPSRIGTTEMFGNTKTKLRDPAWFTALGLVTPPENEEEYYPPGSAKSFFKYFKNAFKSNLRELLP